MSRLRIGMDLDGVIYDWDAELRQLVMVEFGIQLDEAGHWDHYEQQLKALGREDVWPWVWGEGVEKCGLFLGSAYRGALDGLEELAKIGELVIITSRPENARADTFRWLGYEGIPTSEVHIGRKPKSIVGDCDLYVDDGPHNVGDLLYNTRGVVMLWDQPWNRDFDPLFVVGAQHAATRYARAHSWQDVINVAKRLSYRGEAVLAA